MEVANEIIKGVVQVLMVPVKKQLDYLISYKSYVGNMHTKMKDLDVARVGVESLRKQNIERCLEVPAQVSPWLIEVEQMNKKVEDFPSEVFGCLDLKSRHTLGRKAFKIFKEIESVLVRCSLIQWTNVKIPPGRINSTMASTSTPSIDRNDFPSRVQTYNKALEALSLDHKPHMVALCGMGGVGKTTMMKKLRQAVIEKNMFGHFVEAVIGEKTDPIAIQKAVAEYLGIELTESTKPARTEKLRKWFTNNSDGGKKKFLVILDDVWQPVDLEDIGLSPTPDQGVYFKVLITSRDQAVCTEMGVEANSVLKVSLLEKAEAQSLFHQFWKPSDDVDPELHTIGENIVRKCCCLPIAIKTMACTLRSKNKDAWKTALSRLEHHDIKTVAGAVFKTSYDNLQDEEAEAVFLLCGLFPEDFNIPIEELLRYGWGLKLFKGLNTIREARYRLNACIERLMHTNLLIESDKFGCIKMHDLVLSFVLEMFLKDKDSLIVNHGQNSGWPEDDMSASYCKRISLTCEGMYKFPSELKFPNLSILKLMHGDKSLRFPQGFYGEMEKLQVISYDRMQYPLLPSSLECSTNLRVLRLHECSLASDLSSIGNLWNLEVLSFANSGIKSLPSTIKKLKKQRVLDVTNCGGLRIDNGDFKNLVKLEELYACPFSTYGATISFIGDNGNEVAERWNNLSTLEFEFLEDNAQLMNLSFENLERFKISVGRSLKGEYDFRKRKHLFGNTLKLVTKKGKILGSRIDELFGKTVVLCLSVDDMNDIGDIGVKFSLRPQSSSYVNLRILVVSKCAELEYLCTFGVAKVLSNLEHLQVVDCPVMKEVLHIESGGEERVAFPNLKSLSLCRLPELLGLFQNVNIIALPQLVELEIKGIPNITSIYSKNKSATFCLLREEVLIPKLEKLHIEHMDDLKEIWPCDFRTTEEVELREIRVSHCDKLVNMFPCNPMALLHRLEELKAEKCGSIEYLFSPFMAKLLSNLKKIEIRGCDGIEEVVSNRDDEDEENATSTSTHASTTLFPNFEFLTLDSLQNLKCIGGGGSAKGGNNEISLNKTATTTASLDRSKVLQFSQGDGVSWNLCQYAREITLRRCVALSSAIPYYAAGQMQKLEVLIINSCNGMKEVFETQGINNSVTMLKLTNLQALMITGCDLLEHIFTFPTLETLRQLEVLRIKRCKAMKVIVVKEEDDGGEQTTTTSSSKAVVFPRLKCIELDDLPELVGFFLGTNEFHWPSLDGVAIDDCPRMKVFTTGGSTAPQLKYVETSLGKHLPGSWFNSHVATTTAGQHQESTSSSCPAATSQDISIWSFHDLIELDVTCNSSVEKIIVPSTELLHLQKMKKIRLSKCDSVEKVFEALEGTNSTGFDRSPTVLVNLPNLIDMHVEWVDGLRHIWKSNQWTVFKFPNLTTVYIFDCPNLQHVFTSSMVGSLKQLQQLSISYCNRMEEVIVKEENAVVEEEEDVESDGTKSRHVLPRLKSLKLHGLGRLKGFSLGKEDFSFPLLDTLTIEKCPAITTFTRGDSSTPELKEIKTGYGPLYVEEDINSFISIKQEEFGRDGDFIDYSSDDSVDQDF